MAAPRAKVQARPGGSATTERPGGAPAAPGRGPRGTAARPPGRRRSALRSVPAAFGALLVLAALLVGVPALLLYGTRAVTAMGGVGHGGLWQSLSSPDNGQLFLWALVGIGWLGWGCFALSVLLEIPAQLRGRVARRLPAFGWSQRMAAGLVGAVIALLPVAGASFAATGPGQLTAAVAPAQLAAAPQYAAIAGAPAGAPTLALPAADPQSQQQQQQPGYTVRDSRPADSLWSIAERQLGSGERWQEIAKLNAGRVMDASGERFDADRPIQPGWQLLMPADAKPDGAAAGQSGGQQSQAGGQQGQSGQQGQHDATATVRSGDTLSAIAQRELGSSDDWQQLFDANKGVRAPDGETLTDPNALVPGMVLAIPGAPAAQPPAQAQAPAPTPAPVQQSAPAAPAPSAPTPSAPTPSAPAHPGAGGGTAPSAHPSAQPSEHPSARPSGAATGAGAAHQGGGPAAKEGAHRAAGDGDEPIGDYIPALAAAGIGVLLAAVLIGSVAHRRGAQQRARRPRHRIPLPTPPAAAFEAELRARQNSTGLDLLNRSLRTMARNVSRTGKRLPALAAVRVTTGGTVELHLAAAAVPIAPFRAAHAPNVWWCTADSTDLLSAQQAAKVPAPYPALVTLGTAADGAAVLADLETVRLLHLAGHPDDARGVLRTIALELAHSPLADRLSLHLVGFGEDLPVSEVVADRVHRYPSLETALAALEPRIAKARASLVEVGAAHPRDARSRGHADDAWVPEIVLSAQPPIGDVPSELGRLLDGRPRTCLAVVARAPERGAGPVARWTLPSTGQATLPGLNLSFQLQRLSDEQFGHWTELVTTSGSTAQHPAPSWTFDGEELEPADLPKPVPVLVGVSAGTAPFVGESLPEGLPEVGPRLIARVIGTGSSPFASVDPAAATAVPGGSGSGPAGSGPAGSGSVGGGAAGGGSGGSSGSTGSSGAARHSVNGLGRQANNGHPVAPATAVPVLPVLPVAPVVPVLPAVPVPPSLPPSVPDAAADAAPAAEPSAEPVPALTAAPAPVPEPAPTHDTAPPSVLPDPRVPLRPEPVPATPPGGTPTAGPATVRTDADDLLAILRSPEAHAIRTTPRIRLLGPVDVLGACGPTDPATVPALTELAAYLALHPGTGPAAADRALHPGDHARPDQALPATFTALAAWVGSDPDGRAFLRQDDQDSCAFAPTVTCDWDEFRSLYRRGMRSTSSTADSALAHALALVRGAPFAEAPDTGYGWAEAARQDMLAAIVDTAHELAARRLQYGDHRSAEAAVFRGLAVAPDVEMLHRDLFYAYASAGARDQLLKAVNRLDALSRRTGRSLDPDTVALLRDLLSSP
ncbi:LysM peptidoglycan-binding domain-containing protein [Kitasatospora sp. NBC_01287]|uniref:LysM peptidoglycan-binding domain-containing protein n=1 Tax=Kitasatospora sp. NBC_01287 TaxID=2903573 RepID=UPI0022580E91|nr:LysM peptidoglycan-binding domain-containing protein [Kitasatospora sp. NBC_01287]MCX4745236.1 LysM peptidoglycan-binding domain-containing protein [Kitasatospora sp. NBC_01287]